METNTTNNNVTMENRTNKNGNMPWYSVLILVCIIGLFIVLTYRYAYNSGVIETKKQIEEEYIEKANMLYEDYIEKLEDVQASKEVVFIEETPIETRNRQYYEFLELLAETRSKAKEYFAQFSKDNKEIHEIYEELMHSYSDISLTLSLKIELDIPVFNIVEQKKQDPDNLETNLKKYLAQMEKLIDENSLSYITNYKIRDIMRSLKFQERVRITDKENVRKISELESKCQENLDFWDF